jgi:cyclase
VPLRIIARLDIKGPNLVKGIHLEGLRVIGDPHEHANLYYEQGADELIYVDSVASLYGRNSLLDVVERTARDVFIPVTVGGGVRGTDDIRALLNVGADKVAINTAGIRNPEFITEAARTFGSQCIVVNVEAKQQPSGGWEAYTDNGRERTGVDAVVWARRAVQLGAGELLLTSVDREGTRSGFDLALTREIADSVSVPVIACGGAGSASHVAEAVQLGHADAVAVASVLHYRKETISSIKSHLVSRGISVRPAGLLEPHA